MRTTSSKKPMSIVNDAWVATALADDDTVVELLLRLKHAGTVKNPDANLQPPLRWGFRQRRSRPSRLGPGVSVGGFMKKETDSARASPVTPLCWSGGSGSGGSSTSPSAATTVDGFEYTSRQASCSTSTGSGSKVINEISSSWCKRSKKVLTEIEEGNLQLKQRLHLEKKITNVSKGRRAKNQSLKRTKLEHSYGVKNIPISKFNLYESRKPSSISLVKNEQHSSRSYRTTSETKNSEEKGFFFLPDLNMAPTEEEDEATLYGTS